MGLPLIAGSGNIASGQQSDHLLMAAVYQGWVQIAFKVWLSSSRQAHNAD